MPRRREVPKRIILSDPKYNDQLVAKFINGVMLDGKKSTAEQIVYGAFDLMAERAGGDPVDQARAIDELFVVAPAGDTEEGQALAAAAGGRFAPLDGPSGIPGVFARLM